MNDSLAILVLAVTAAFNPTLLAAVTVMLMVPDPRRVMLGYLLGSLLTSIAVGLAIVFALQDATAVRTARRDISPAQDLVFGAILILAGALLRGERIAARREAGRRRMADGQARQSLPERLLGRGSPRVAFFAGVLLTFPGASYLAALAKVAKLDVADGVTVAVILGFCIVQQALLEIPMVAFSVDPEDAARKVSGLRAWLAENGWRAAANAAIVLGALLWARGVIAAASA